MPRGIGRSIDRNGWTDAVAGSIKTEAVAGVTKAVACASPRQHSCLPAATGTSLFVSRGEALQKTLHKVDGAPSRPAEACTSGCRKLKVIANSATARAAARQPD